MYSCENENMSIPPLSLQPCQCRFAHEDLPQTSLDRSLLWSKWVPVLLPSNVQFAHLLRKHHQLLQPVQGLNQTPNAVLPFPLDHPISTRYILRNLGFVLVLFEFWSPMFSFSGSDLTDCFTGRRQVFSLGELAEMQAVTSYQCLCFKDMLVSQDGAPYTNNRGRHFFASSLTARSVLELCVSARFCPCLVTRFFTQTIFLILTISDISWRGVCVYGLYS